MRIRIEPPRTKDQTTIAACAYALLDVPFRLHGRTVESGLDCVGVVAHCLSETGYDLEPPTNYRVRGDFEERISAFFEAGKFEAVEDSLLVSGDILLLRPGPRQIHLAVVTPKGAVHAHMGLGRVVLTPLPLSWPLIGQWRFHGD